VRQILEAVVAAVSAPVTLKMRTGWDPEHRNGIAIARMAEAIGIQALAVHGRTRACMYRGEAEYETIRAIKQSVSIPIFANGDIDSPYKAKLVLEQTGADGLMVGRNAQGRPWIFREIDAYLRASIVSAAPSLAEVRDIMLAHLRDLHAFYGEEAGVRVARKHIDWYARGRAAGHALRHAVMQAEDAQTQLACADAYFDSLVETYGAKKKNESSSRADRKTCAARAAAADDDRGGARVLLRDAERPQTGPALRAGPA
jgi:tRNA-dihydrouridine synthase B